MCQVWLKSRRTTDHDLFRRFTAKLCEVFWQAENSAPVDTSTGALLADMDSTSFVRLFYYSTFVRITQLDFSVILDIAPIFCYNYRNDCKRCTYMLKYPCLVLDHDDTVVQTEKALAYPCFKEFIEQIRPGRTLTYQEYVHDCSRMVFADMCRQVWGFTEEELREEYFVWKDFIKQHIPPICPGIDRIIRRQREEGGLICVASLSTTEVILRDYDHHFGITPDAIYDYDLPTHLRKPNPYPLLDIMEKYRLAPSDILVVDDMKLAWKMASSVGVPIAFAAWGKLEFPQLSKEMTELCDFSFESPQKLANFLFD